MQRYTMNIAPGENRMINARGTFIRFTEADSGSESATIIITAGSSQAVLMPGQAVRLESPADLWIISTKEGQGVSGAVVIGNGDFEDSRVFGTVAIADAGLSAVQAGRAFSAYWRSPIGDSEEVGHQLGLVNPVGSGVDLIIDAVKLDLYATAEGYTSAQEANVLVRPDEHVVTGGHVDNYAFGSLNSSKYGHKALKGHAIIGAALIRTQFEASEKVFATDGKYEFQYPYVIRQGGTFLLDQSYVSTFGSIGARFYWRELDTLSTKARVWGMVS